MIEPSFFSIKHKTAQYNLLGTLNNLFFVLMLATLVFLIAFRLMFSGAVVFGNSMKPTLNAQGNDTVYINHHAEYSYGDIIALHKSDRTDIIKRVIALEGDKVNYVYNAVTKEYEVFVNDVKLDEPFTIPLTINTNDPEKITGDPLIILRQNSAYKYDFESLGVYDYGEGCYIVPENCVFVMGDNRPSSVDSRNAGAFNKEDIIGKVEFIIPAKENRFLFFVKMLLNFEGMFNSLKTLISK